MNQYTANPLDKYIFPSNKPLQTGIAGKVFAAFERKTHRPVVVKVADISVKCMRQSFDRERYFLGKLVGNSKVVRIFESFVVDNLGFLVMERKFCDLYDRTEDNSFSLEKARQILFQVVLALCELHRVGVAHLDIKPENILLDESDSVYICDFGTAVEVNYFGEKNYDYVGSVFYISPEVLDPKNGYDPFKSDVWSLGILFYVLITGKYPFAGETPEETFTNFKNSVLNYSELDNMKNYEIFQNLIENMLQIDPLKRISLSEIITHPFFL